MFLFTLPSIFVGFVIPVFITYYALTLKDLNQIRTWLAYWLVVAIGLQLESFLAPVTALVPFYSLLRIFAFVWLMHPQTHGALLIFDSYIEPFIASKSDMFDRAVQRFSPSHQLLFAKPAPPPPTTMLGRVDAFINETDSYQEWAFNLPMRGQEYLRSWGFNFSRTAPKPEKGTSGGDYTSKSVDVKADSNEEPSTGSSTVREPAPSSQSIHSTKQDRPTPSPTPTEEEYDIVEL